jgi:hypothetical protein
LEITKIKNIISVISLIVIFFVLSACSGEKTGSASPISAQSSVPYAEGYNSAAVSEQNSSLTGDIISVDFDGDDLDSSLESSVMSYINLNGDSISLVGSGALIMGSTVTITSGGVYSISGTLDNGQIIVYTDNKDPVKLVFNSVDITCSSSAPVYIMNSKKTIITLAEGTENSVTYDSPYLSEDDNTDEPDATIYSKDDLTINGKGSLAVSANCHNGIVGKDKLKIVSGSISVKAASDGIKGKDFLAVLEGNITVEAGNDGMQSNNAKDADKGFIYIKNGMFDITAGTDGIKAETYILIENGAFSICTGGSSINSSTDSEKWGNWGSQNDTAETENNSSAKGIKAGTGVIINGGTINIDSSDDSIHSNDSIKIMEGDIILSSGDDGIHADSTIEINNGNISITKCYEGIESANITINDGDFNIFSSDDGINIVGGNDRSSLDGRPGQNNFSTSGNNYLYINGGYVVIDSGGDGIDINGSIEMTDGTVIINGPTVNNEGAIDYYSVFDIYGGFLIAVGSSGMPEAPSTSSTQHSVMINLESSQPANTMIGIETENGENIISFLPEKAYQSVVLSSPVLKNGMGCVVYTGGSSTGESKDGLYTNSTYTGGSEVASFTISSMVTVSGTSGGGMPGGGHRFHDEGDMVPGQR